METQKILGNYPQLSQEVQQDASLLEAVKFAEKYMMQHTNEKYHNIGHALDVAEDCLTLSKLTNSSDLDKKAIIYAALFHDLENNFDGSFSQSGEEYSAKLASHYLSEHDATYKSKVGELIIATEFSTKPANELESMLKDADLASFGKNSFWKSSDLVRQELYDTQNKKFSEEEWFAGRLKLLSNHQWYSDAGKKLWTDGLQKNIEVAKSKYDGIKRGE